MENLTHEEHEARAMLLGLRYHHGNGDPFYYRGGETIADIDVSSMLDANTLESMVMADDNGTRWLKEAGRNGHRAWITDNLAARDARVAKRKKP